MIIPQSEIELNALSDGLGKFSQRCTTNEFWLPIFKNFSAKNWVDDESKFVEFTKWKRGEPNGGHKETCASINTDFEYSDTHCGNHLCFYCRVKDFKQFQLKGLCKSESSVLDHKFVMRPNVLVNEKPTWKGFTSNTIYWNKDTKLWELSDSVTNVVLASLESEQEFPVGENVWEILSENVCDEKPKGSLLRLMLSKCDENEYSCSDGSCIPILQKCNFVPDCWDGKDEDLCPILRFKNAEGYKSDLPDITFNEDLSIKKQPVHISMIIQHIESVQEVKMRFTASFILRAEWIDSRLTWNDLNTDKYLNLPSSSKKDLFWVPKIIFGNSENSVEIPTDSKAKILIAMKGNLTMSDQFNLQETAFYSGADNPVIYSREFDLDFKCFFILTYFPFDSQTCTIELKSGNKVRNFIQLVPKHLDYIGHKKLATFHVKDWTIEMDSSSNDVDIRVKLVLKRRIAQHLLGIYLPSLCIMIIAQVYTSTFQSIL